MSDLARLGVRQHMLQTTDPEHPLFAGAAFIGPDLLVWIWGGEAPHVGAVAAAESRPSLADPARRSASSSVITYLGHKEDMLVKRVAEALAAAFGCRVVVTAGIHWDRVTPQALAAVERGTVELIAALSALPRG